MGLMIDYFMEYGFDIRAQIPFSFPLNLKKCRNINERLDIQAHNLPKKVSIANIKVRLDIQIPHFA